MLPYEMTVDQIMAANSEIAIVPIASVEQHGHHLPINTDVLIADAFAARIAQKLNAFLVPTLPVSTNREHMGKRGGAVWMRPQTCMSMLTDICLCLHEQGFHKIIILQSHGGIFVLPPTVRDLNAKYQPDLHVCKFEIMQVYGALHQEGILETTSNIHADEFETSLILHLRPELVHVDKIVDFVPDVPREYLNYGSIFRCCPDGVWGAPSKGTAQKGEALLTRGAELAIPIIEAAFAYMANKENIGYSAF